MRYLLNNLLSYKDIIDNDIKDVGAKAYNVALLSKEFNVPKGIVLYDLPIKTNEIKEALNCSKYIVRSSSNVEDSKNLSWAGCFDTIPNVSIEELEEAIKTCLDSKNNERVKEYKKLHNVNKEVKISVIIQEYIESDYNGVAFSANPVDGNDNECIIEYQKGLTGNVVGGFGNSQTLIIDKNNPIIDNNDLDSSIIEELLSILNSIEKKLNDKVDIEFLIKNDIIYITQARPMTT